MGVIQLMKRYFLGSHYILLMILLCSFFSLLLLLQTFNRYEDSSKREHFIQSVQMKNFRLNDAHLAVLRKELDKSNYSSHIEDTKPKTLELSKTAVDERMKISADQRTNLHPVLSYESDNFVELQKMPKRIKRVHGNLKYLNLYQEYDAFPREVGTWLNHFYFSDFERHTAEIAAYHLDRVLKFYKCIPTVGRLINITRDIYDLATDEKFIKTFFTSPDGNYCFTGRCSYYCDTSHAICGTPDVVEGSMATFLPFQDLSARTTKRHPFKRSYHKRKQAEWEMNPNYCLDSVLTRPEYKKPRRMLDVTDLCIFDFFQGNMDRHHFEIFTDFGNESFPIVLDNGRGFGKAHHDELSILAPLYQCCHVRYSTLQTLLAFHNGATKLSEAMRDSLKHDPLDAHNRILSDDHLKALDRRLGIILDTVRKCVAVNGFKGVVFDDGL